MLQKLFKPKRNPEPMADVAVSPFELGETVYILQEYYVDNGVSQVEIPRFGWKVTHFDGELVQIESRSKKAPMSMHLKIQTKYLKKE